MTALAELVRHSSGRKIRFDERQVERNCLVASGVFLANFLPGEDSIWLYSGTDHPTDDGGGGGGADDVGEFLAEVGDRVGARIVNETEPGTVRRIRYSQRCSAYLARMEDREKRARMLEQLLSNLTAQTGLKFRQAKRPFPVWFAVEAEGGARRQQ